MATLKVQSAPAGLVCLLQKATTAPGCFTSSEKRAKKSVYLREQIMVLFIIFESHMLETELNGVSCGLLSWLKCSTCPRFSSVRNQTGCFKAAEIGRMKH